MKNIPLIVIAAAFLLAAVPIPAQGPPEEELDFAPSPEHFMASPAPGQRPPPEPPPGFEPMAPEGMSADTPPEGPPRHVERWLERLRERNPEEFERMRKMRQEDPGAFHQALAQRLRRERMKGGRPPGGPDRIMTPEIETLEKETREMSKAYRAAATDGEKAALRGALRAKLETLFDLRERERAQRIGEIEKHLADLKGALEQRAARRDQIIEHRLLQLTEGETLAW